VNTGVEFSEIQLHGTTEYGVYYVLRTSALPALESGKVYT